MWRTLRSSHGANYRADFGDGGYSQVVFDRLFLQSGSLEAAHLRCHHKRFPKAPGHLAGYVREAVRDVRAQQVADLLAGKLHLPKP